MCDQTEVSYLENDVVWVKIGPIWWPGVVKDLEKDEEGQDILASLKKKPIAVVKFFQEDNYEFVKNLDHIYHYSCRKKDEFIKKGLDKFRTGAAHMKKFPADVTTAESLTNGDVNIIHDPKFYPEKKESYSEIFGSGKKKTKKEPEISPKAKTKSSAAVPPYRPITHQRFIKKALHGESDHKVKTLIQCNSGSDDNASGNPYKCHICKFETSRVNVIVAHHRLAHSSKNSINWTGSDDKLIRRKPNYKSRKIKNKKLLGTSKESDSEEEEEKEEAEKKKSPKGKSKEKTKDTDKNKKESSTTPAKRKGKNDSEDTAQLKKPRFTDVLLADWDEEEDDEKKDENTKNDEVNLEKSTDAELVSKNDDKNEPKDETVTEQEESEKPKSPVMRKSQNEKMSCFDFDEEEEGFIGMSNANTYGRKIPRVIPVKEKSELGMDLEIEELFKKKSEPDIESSSEKDSENKEIDIKKESEEEAAEMKNSENKETPKPTKGPEKRRRSKASKEEEPSINPEESLALRRTRRPGAKKSYLNEVIEKVVEDPKPENNKKPTEKAESILKTESKSTKEEGGSSSRRKQDFKQHKMGGDRDEIVYSEVLSNEQKGKTEPEKKKTRSQSKDSRKGNTDDLTAQIDSLLEETKVPSLSDLSGSSPNKTVDKKSTSLSFDYLPSEQTGRKSSKNLKELKSISKMFSDSLPGSESSSETLGIAQSELQGETSKDSLEEKTAGQSSPDKNVNLKLSSSSNTQKRGSIVLSSVPATSDGGVTKVKVLPVVRQTSTGKECIVLPGGKKLKTGDETDLNSETEATLPKNIKAIKVKSDSLPSSLITTGKLKGQTIIHQKGGKYVIVTQSPTAGRQKIIPGKVQSGSKVVILTNQLGEQKIISTGGLQQAKFKVDGQKIITSSDSVSDKDAAASVSGSSTSHSQPVIKMVPDGKGGIMKQLTVSPKKVLLGGTKVLMSASSSPNGNSVQKITLSGGGTVSKTGGDYRLIENYKGTGKTVLIQGGSSATSGVVLKPTSGVARQVTKVIQSSQSIPALKKKPKILMRASGGQTDYVVQSAESPTIVVKQKGADGKFATQKIVRTDVVNASKASVTGSGTKAFFISGQGSNKKGESYFITTNESGKVIRMRQKIKDADVNATKTQKVIQKSPEVYSISQNNILIPSEAPVETETSQIVQIQDPSQQSVLQTQVIAMPGPVGADGNQTYVLVSVDENGIVQGMDNSVVAYDATAQPDSIYVNPTSEGNVMLINSQESEEAAPVFSSSSQDILAEALANTNVLEGTISNEMENVVPSILLPPSIPSSVVQETSITLQKPIMTPLEMPSSVAPDTSGLEPPPLPPTPTDEDVLMEESDVPGKVIQTNSQQVVTPISETIQTYIESENFESEKTVESAFDQTKANEEVQGTVYYQTEEINDSSVAQPEQNQTEFIEEPITNSYQSLPVLNDEPDTSDDAHTGEQVTEDTEKSRVETENFSQPLRGQEPPSSTNNEIVTESSTIPQESKYDHYNQSSESENSEKNSTINESESGVPESQNESQVEKETVTHKESQSLPVLAEESNINSYEVDPYSDVMSQKRFQEETEVSSTTDEISNKNDN